MSPAGEPLLRSASRTGGVALPVGWDRVAAHAGWQEHRIRVGRRASKQENARGLWLQTPRQYFRWIDDYAAADFLAAFGSLAGDFGAAFFSAFVLSFAANSCLTLAAMASVSTL